MRCNHSWCLYRARWHTWYHTLYGWWFPTSQLYFSWNHSGSESKNSRLLPAAEECFCSQRFLWDSLYWSRLITWSPTAALIKMNFFFGWGRGHLNCPQLHGSLPPFLLHRFLAPPTFMFTSSLILLYLFRLPL